MIFLILVILAAGVLYCGQPGGPGRVFGWRNATWGLIIFNALMISWMIVGPGAIARTCLAEGCSTLTLVRAAIGGTFVVVIWLIGFVVLSLLWLRGSPPMRICPQCGPGAKLGYFYCPECGFDLAIAAGRRGKYRRSRNEQRYQALATGKTRQIGYEEES